MWVEFDCEICAKHVRKQWGPSSPGRPRFCCWDCKSEAQRRLKPVSKEWLEQKYLVEKMGAPDIAKIVGRDSKRVWEWLRDLGIPTRKRGQNTAVHFKKGAPSAFIGCSHTPEYREEQRQRRFEDGRVPYLKNGVHHLKGKRGAETPNWKGGLTPAREKLAGTPEWKQVVRAVWMRDSARCQRCGLTCKEGRPRGIAFDIHHIVGFEVEALRCVVSNLVLLCEPCHYWVHSRKNEKKEFIG